MSLNLYAKIQHDETRKEGRKISKKTQLKSKNLTHKKQKKTEEKERNSESLAKSGLRRGLILHD